MSNQKYLTVSENLIVNKINSQIYTPNTGDVNPQPVPGADIFYYIPLVQTATGTQPLLTDSSTDYLSYSATNQILFVGNELSFYSNTQGVVSNELGPITLQPAPGSYFQVGSVQYPTSGGLAGQVLTMNDDEITSSWKTITLANTDSELKKEVSELRKEIQELKKIINELTN